MFNFKHWNPRQHRILGYMMDGGYGLSCVGAGMTPVILAAPWNMAGCVACSVAAAGALAIKGVSQVVADKPPADVESLNCGLSVLHSITVQAKKTQAVEPKLRLCVYVRDPHKAGYLRRVTAQVGDTEIEDEPREFSVKVGLVGKVALTGKPLATKLEPGVDLIEFLNEWGFDRHEAAEIRPDRRSWYGIPLGVSGTTCLGVLFCDSADPFFFGEQRSPRRKLLRQGAIPIATTLKDVYNSLAK